MFAVSCLDVNGILRFRIFITHPLPPDTPRSAALSSRYLHGLSLNFLKRRTTHRVIDTTGAAAPTGVSLEIEIILNHVRYGYSVYLFVFSLSLSSFIFCISIPEARKYIEHLDESACCRS